MTAVAPTEAREADMPGEAGLWLFLLAEMSVFAVIFGIVVKSMTSHPESFAASQATLQPGLGLLNTQLLLASSLFVALGVQRARRHRDDRCGHVFTAGMACGAGFVVIKAVEYGQKFAHGVGLHTNEFFTLYFVSTGVHLAHVLFGLGVLWWIRRRALRGGDLMLVEGGACYWHMVDLVWVVLFTLFYLAR